ncbi:Phosphotyrosyl phosphatase activator [Basidiobolus meristosporus CBS 931.73]|uniref:Serine/threonine-protein phosphatase 2A activator n=1 Tax=Basidiobolus meristosporus CBS 931.73 TaxID=1314790 RepID=A0A1Y1XHR3_9FUNG|nr:Phosphotyrosyl phosphatase activator [Basidiobolus meristosporus CBS 931.73]|eukprot:ORX85285.1 Phosphotyrosyl phosphatase activator [Basidiobolus meristosporus CBS 931.73]
MEFVKPSIPAQPAPAVVQKVVTKCISLSEIQCIEPIRRIVEEPDVQIWTKSEAFARIMTYIHALNESVKNKKISDHVEVSENVNKLLSVLEILDSWIAEIPPLQNPQRFGNKAFRTWMKRLNEDTQELLNELVSSELHQSIIELKAYFCGGFGNAIRIDYGSGHELSFVAFLCCLDLIGFFGESDRAATALRIIVRYLELVRKLQRVYMLEPAGSHGVWGLDDYQFLPYLWGSAQLLDHKHIKPRSVLNQEIVNTYASEYLYLRCIQFIHEVKKGPFPEHSPILYDISGVPYWGKVNSGMFKMYIGDVLNKFPIVQHLLFGSLLPFIPAQPSSG